MRESTVASSRNGWIQFEHKAAFWAGVVMVTAGVLLHLPMYLNGADMGYRLVDMPMDTPMVIGMFAIIVGLLLTLYGLYPRNAAKTQEKVAKINVRALDDSPINRAHVGLLFVMAIAVTIDVMKPTALAFIAPGVAEEYGLRSAANPTASVPVALLPLAGIIGTVIGSLVWGWLADRIGRRASILFASVIFIGTSICGSMPVFEWNIAMCFIMGLGAGGMLPITFALMAETMPVKHRGWLMVLIGGDVAGAYIITAWLASALVPTYSWRILWLIGLPTGLLLLGLNRWIPESPRYLLASGREREARAVMSRYGARVIEDPETELNVEESVTSSWSQLFRTGFGGMTSVVILLGLGIGLVSFGFQLWIPSNLRQLGFDEVSADRMLRDSALIGFPLNFVIAWMYGFWSSKKTLIMLTALTAAAMFGFVILGDSVVENEWVLRAMLVVPIWGISSLISVMSSYSSEVYPTKVRARGTGIAAGATKAGGVLIIALVAAAVAPPSIVGTALAGAIPLTIAVVALMVFGVETRKRRLESITAEEMGLA